MVTTAPIQPHSQMPLGIESDAFGMKTWKCVVSWFLVCLLQVIQLLGGPNQETLPKRIPKKLQGGKNQVIINPRLSQPRQLRQHNHKFASGIKTIHVDQDETYKTQIATWVVSGSKLTQPGFVADMLHPQLRQSKSVLH